MGARLAQCFAGWNRLLLPGDLTGLYQVNATVPTGITPGNQAQAVLGVAGALSPPVTMAVK